MQVRILNKIDEHGAAMLLTLESPEEVETLRLLMNLNVTIPATVRDLFKQTNAELLRDMMQQIHSAIQGAK